MCHLMKPDSLLHAFTLQATKAGVGGLGTRVRNVNITNYWMANNTCQNELPWHRVRI